jgi:chromosome segregation ATPase
MAEIKWTDIFDFSDSSNIKEAVNLIDQLGKSYKGFLQSINKSADKSAKALKGINDELSKQAEILKSLNPLVEENKAIIQQTAVSMTDTAKSHKVVNDELKQYKKIATDAKKASDNLEAASKKVKGAVDAEKGSFADLQQKLKQANKERDNTAKILNGKLNPAFEEATAKAAKLQSEVTSQRQSFQQAAKTIDQSVDSYFSLNKQLVEARKRYKGLSGEERKNSKEGKKLLKQIQKLDAELKDMDRTIGQAQRNVGDYALALKGATTKVVALAGAGALLGGALDTAKDAFAGSEEGSKTFNKALNTGMATASGFFDAIIKTAKETENLSDVFDNLGKNFENFDDKTF